jgi:ATP-dependent Clp protease ATP-binding subunit ClpB
VYGARPLKRVIQQRVQNELANAMPEGRFAEGSVVKVDAAADGFCVGRVEG